MANYKNFKKTITITTLLFVVLMILPPFVQASNEKITRMPLGTKTMTMDELFSIAQPSKESLSIKEGAVPFVEAGDVFDIPAEIKATLSKEEIYALKGLPGYFTPKQISVQQVSYQLLDQQMLLLTNPQPVKAVIIIDEEAYDYYACHEPWLATWEGCCTWATNILEGGDDYLEVPFGIDFQADIFAFWDTPDTLVYSQLLDNVSQSPGIDPRGVGCDVLIVMSGQFGGYTPQGGVIHGLTWGLGEGTPMGGRHSIMDIRVDLPANLFQHEVSHFFGAPDHLFNPSIYCIMSYTYTYVTRLHCTDCAITINQNKARYD